MAVRVVAGATSPTTVAVAPLARSTCALLIAIGVAYKDLDGVIGILAELETPESLPRSFQEIAEQAEHAHKVYLERMLHEQGTVEADAAV